MGDGTTELDIIHRVVGRGTTALARMPGRQVSLLGPLGVGFGVPGDLQVACLVGGGVGIPPMLYLAEAGGEGVPAGGVFRGEAGGSFAGDVELEEAIGGGRAAAGGGGTDGV